MASQYCEIEGCARPRKYRLWCGTHYARWRKHGSPLTTLNAARVDGSLEERFLAKVRKDESCWIWTGHTDRWGYGRFGIGTKTFLAHRVAYEEWIGPIPEGLLLDHLCHSRAELCKGGPSCPHRRCVNPAHLEPVTLEENVRRGHQARNTQPRNGSPRGVRIDGA